MKKRILIVGGADGLGLELARIYLREGHRVCVTGVRDPKLAGVKFEHLDVSLGASALGLGIDRVLGAFSGVNTVVYAAYGSLEQSAPAVPMMLVERLMQLDRLRGLGPLKVMLVVGGSLGMEAYGAELVRRDGIGKVLVTVLDETGAAGLDVGWVAEQIVGLSGGAFKYKSARILGGPDRVEVVACLNNAFEDIGA